MKRYTFGKYAGLKISGKKKMSLPDESSHIERASWLTAQVESGGKFGCVINYDGTGMTSGIHQAIAVYPRELKNEDFNAADDQGPLWELIHRIVQSSELPEDVKLFSLMDEARWDINENRQLVGSEGLVLGRDIREAFTGSADGVLPMDGEGRERAEDWVRAFHELFTLESTFSAQLEFGLSHFRWGARRKLRFTKKFKDLRIEDVVYGKPLKEVTVDDLGDELDLAMCMFWSNNVNAPGAALRKMCSAVKHVAGETQDQRRFSKTLIRALGNTKFGRWDDDIKNGRYQRTRKYAMQLWPEELFRGSGAIMPKDLLG